MKRSLGARAVLLGYFLPFLIVLLALVIILYFTDNEGLSAIVAITLLIPYYLILYLLKDRLSKDFIFTIDNPISN
jgi:sigma-E factor negative regulatory protein RseC